MFKGESVHITLTANEALVLFDALTRFCETDTLEIEDQAEQQALWKLLAQFEKQLVEPFRQDYRELLAAARDRLRDVVE